MHMLCMAGAGGVMLQLCMAAGIEALGQLAWLQHEPWVFLADIGVTKGPAAVCRKLSFCD